MNQDLTWIKDRLVRLDGPKMLQVSSHERIEYQREQRDEEIAAKRR
jgi:hypothetical protein